VTLVYGDYISFYKKDSPFVLEVARPSDYRQGHSSFQRNVLPNELKAGQDRRGNEYVHYVGGGQGGFGASSRPTPSPHRHMSVSRTPWLPISPLPKSQCQL